MLHVFDRHFGHLPPEITKFLVMDIQNDCTCSIEKYESDLNPEWAALVLHPGRVEATHADQVVVPIHKKMITKADLDLLYAEACRVSVPEDKHDVHPIHKIGETDVWEYRSPEAEYFGVLTCNLAGWGAFCFPNQLFRQAKEANV